MCAVASDAPRAARAALPVRQAAGEWVWSMPGETDAHVPPLTFPRPDDIDDDVERLLDGARRGGRSPPGAAHAFDSPAPSDPGEHDGSTTAMESDGSTDSSGGDAPGGGASVGDDSRGSVGFVEDTVEGAEGGERESDAEVLPEAKDGCIHEAGKATAARDACTDCSDEGGGARDGVADVNATRVETVAADNCAAEAGRDDVAGVPNSDEMRERTAVGDDFSSIYTTAGRPVAGHPCADEARHERISTAIGDRSGATSAKADAGDACAHIDATGGTVSEGICADDADKGPSAGDAELAMPEPLSPASVQTDPGGPARSHSWCVPPGEGSNGGSVESVGSSGTHTSGDGLCGPDALYAVAAETEGQVRAPAPRVTVSTRDNTAAEAWAGGEGGSEPDAEV